MATIKQEIFPLVLTEKRGDKMIVHYHFGVLELPPGKVLQPLLKDGIYLQEGTTGSGEVFPKEGTLGISKDGSGFGREVVATDANKDQFVAWKLWQLITV